MYKMDFSQPQPIPDLKSRSEAYFYAENGTVQDFLSIDINSEIAIPFIIQVSEPGFYLISVLVPVTPEDLSVAEKEAGEDWTWSDQKIIAVN